MYSFTKLINIIINNYKYHMSKQICKKKKNHKNYHNWLRSVSEILIADSEHYWYFEMKIKVMKIIINNYELENINVM